MSVDLDKVRAFMRERSYMDPDSDAGEGVLAYGTRDNGDVGEERPGRADITHARDMRKELELAFDVKVEIDTCDEWVNLYIRPTAAIVWPVAP